MKTLRRFIALSLSLSLLHSVAKATDAPTLNGILQKHLEAMGGLNNWHKVESIRLSGTIVRGSQTVDIVIVKKRPNQIRATVTVPIPGKKDEAFQIIRAHDGKNAWTATRLAGAPEMLKEELSKEAADELLADAGVLPPLIKLWREGVKLKLTGTESNNGVGVYCIQTAGVDLPLNYTFYLDPDSYLITHYQTTHPINGITHTTLEEYQEEQHVLIATHSIIEAHQTGKSVINTSSVQIGVGIYEDYFKANDYSNTMVGEVRN